jgi:hypothetical protein
MKKIFVLFFLFSSLGVYPTELKENISFGALGAGIDTWNNKGYIQGSVLSFLYQSDPGFGIQLSPLNFFMNIKDNNDFSLTFLNLSFFYNIIRDEDIIIGPFASINALNYNRLDFFELRSGVLFKLRNISFEGIAIQGMPNNSRELFGFDLITVEAGYKFNNGRHGAYGYLGVDLLGALLISGMNISAR